MGGWYEQGGGLHYSSMGLSSLFLSMPGIVGRLPVLGIPVELYDTMVSVVGRRKIQHQMAMGVYRATEVYSSCLLN